MVQIADFLSQSQPPAWGLAVYLIAVAAGVSGALKTYRQWREGTPVRKD